MVGKSSKCLCLRLENHAFEKLVYGRPYVQNNKDVVLVASRLGGTTSRARQAKSEVR